MRGTTPCSSSSVLFPLVYVNLPSGQELFLRYKSRRQISLAAAHSALELDPIFLGQVILRHSLGTFQRHYLFSKDNESAQVRKILKEQSLDIVKVFQIQSQRTKAEFTGSRALSLLIVIVQPHTPRPSLIQISPREIRVSPRQPAMVFMSLLVENSFLCISSKIITKLLESNEIKIQMLRRGYDDHH